MLWRKRALFGDESLTVFKFICSWLVFPMNLLHFPQPSNILAEVEAIPEQPHLKYYCRCDQNQMRGAK
jgi:hypothetical protein